MSAGSMSTHGVLFEGQRLNHRAGAPRLRAVLTMAPTSLLPPSTITGVAA
jgi:hypothetical protein